MQALLDTIQHERAGRGAMASRAIAPSCSTTIDAHQRGRASYRVLSRGHHVHVVSNQPKKGFSTEPCPAVLTLPPVDWRRFGRRPFPIHVSARGILLPRWSRKRVCSIPLGHTRAYSHDLTGANRSVVQSAPRKHVSRRLAYVGKHLRRLSSVSDLVGIDPNENGLTHAQASFAPGAKAND